jgi:hypothetical protein
MLDLGIVIVNYRTCDLLRECLQSIYESRGDFGYEVCVVDNCSQDGSCAMVGQEFPQVRLIESEVNGGYAYANNLGLRALGFAQTSEVLTTDSGQLKQKHEVKTSGKHAVETSEVFSSPGYALLLNPDTLLPPSALQEMLGFMKAHPEAGVAGPRLVLADGSLDLACRRSFPSPEVSFYRMVGLSKLFPKSRRFGRYNLTYLDPDEVAEVDSVVGAFMLVRAEALRQVGLLDESFFMYGEDLDWAYRIKKAGWKVYYNPQVTVLHYKRAASRHSRKASYEFYRAMRIFYRKHYAATTPFWLHWLVLGGIALRGGLGVLYSRLLWGSQD